MFVDCDALTTVYVRNEDEKTKLSNSEMTGVGTNVSFIVGSLAETNSLEDLTNDVEVEADEAGMVEVVDDTLETTEDKSSSEVIEETTTENLETDESRTSEQDSTSDEMTKESSIESSNESSEDLNEELN